MDDNGLHCWGNNFFGQTDVPRTLVFGRDLTPAGAILVVLDRQFGIRRGRLMLTASNDGPELASPEAGSLGDATLGGALLRLFNPDTGESATLTLPSEAWSGLGDPSGSTGYVYRDPTGRFGPCSAVTLLGGRSFSARCRGREIDFSLNELRQGRLGLILELGEEAGGSRYCMEFGGHVVRDRRAFWFFPGTFFAIGAPRPAACPDWLWPRRTPIAP